MQYTKLKSDQLRKGRVSIQNQIYSITTVTRRRTQIFSELKPCRILINILMECERRNQAETLCFVVMPDHFHWLMQLTGNEGLSSIIKKVKTITSRRMGIPIWQKGYYDRAIRRDEDVKAIARYIIANPVRAGIVKSVKYYPHWDACWI